MGREGGLVQRQMFFLWFFFFFLSLELSVLRKVGGTKKLEVSTDVSASKVAIVHCGRHKKVGALEMSMIVVTCIIIQQCCEWTPNFMCIPFKNASCHLKRC